MMVMLQIQVMISLYLFNNFSKSQRNEIKIFKGSVTVLQKMANYQETTVKLTNTQFSKSKSAAKNKRQTILRLNKKNFEDEGLPL